jgi:hypothetical protein
MTEDRDAPQKSRRHKAEAGLEFAESALFEEMEHAAKLLKSEEDFGRSGVSHAVYACYSFLHVRGLTGYALKPLADLVRAFQSVDEGVLPELFDPNIKSGELPYRKWSRSWAATETKIYAAACMDALMETGSSKDEAAKRVARATDSWPRISTGHIKKSTVVNWRDELLQQNRQGQEWLLFSGLSKYFSVDPNARKRLKKVLEEGPTLMSGVRKERK